MLRKLGVLKYAAADPRKFKVGSRVDRSSFLDELERNGVPLVAVPRRLGGGAPDRPLSTLLEGLGPTNPPSLTEPVPLEATLPPPQAMNPV